MSVAGPRVDPVAVPVFTAHLLGVRGSTPAPGDAHARYGGHTSCVALQAAGADQPDLVLDAGTGLRDLAALLTRPFDGTLLLSHLHWDHTHGLPFSGAVLDPLGRLRLVVPTEAGGTALDALLPGISPPAFPVPVDELSPTWSFHAAEPERVIDRWRVLTRPIRHKGGRTLGIRIELDGRSLVYMPDHDLRAPDPDAAGLAEGADVLLHDAQYVADEIAGFSDYGHSTVERACSFARETGVRHLVLTHHGPARTDQELDAISRAFTSDGPGPRISVGRQGAAIAVP